MTRSFAELPGLVEELLSEHDRVALVYFDAFGWRFLERHSDHRLFASASVEKWSAQFPSTTTVHSTTIHTGLPLAEHGLYEWHVYEPRLDRLIIPLFLCFAGELRRDSALAAGLRVEDVFPFPTLYQRLEVPSHVVMPATFAASSPNVRLTAGSTVHPFRTPADGFARLAGALAAEERAYGTIYLPDVDSFMHEHGPDAPEVPGLIDATLTALADAPWPDGTLVLVTADHGMAAISPERTSYLNVVWPELARHLVHGADGKPLAPAGSARDVFLHVLPDRLDEVHAELARRLEGKAEVRRTDDGLFPELTETLRARLANLVVLPHPGEAAYWLDPPWFEQRFLAQHGGLSPDEMEIPLVRWLVG
ncbi:MAG TPA: alkaline phosphatase family protein [Gaiellaceae bacterium]|nr:alkaline phosphatase family protein [Gaiellaceae bacterium]